MSSKVGWWRRFLNYLAVLPFLSLAFTYQPEERERSRASSSIKSRVVLSMVGLPCCPPPPLPGFTYQPKKRRRGGRSRIPCQRRTLGCSGASKVGQWGSRLSSCLLSLPVRRASRLAISEPVALIVELPCCPVPPLPDYYLSARKQRITMEAEKQDIQYYEKYISRQGLSMVERPFCPPASYLLLLPGLCVTTRKRKQSRSRIFSFIQRLIGVDC